MSAAKRHPEVGEYVSLRAEGGRAVKVVGVNRFGDVDFRDGDRLRQVTAWGYDTVETVVAEAVATAAQRGFVTTADKLREGDELNAYVDEHGADRLVFQLVVGVEATDRYVYVSTDGGRRLGLFPTTKVVGWRPVIAEAVAAAILAGN